MTEVENKKGKKVVKKIIRRIIKKADGTQVVQKIPVTETVDISPAPETKSEVNLEQEPIENIPELETESAQEENKEEKNHDDHLGMADMFSLMMDGKEVPDEKKEREEKEKKEQERLQQELAEQAILQAQQMHAHFDESGWGGYFFEFTTAAFFVVCENQIIHINKGVLNLLHYRFEQDILEKNFLNFVAEDSKRDFENSKGLLFEEHQTIEIKMLGNGGRRIEVRLSARTVPDDNYFTYLVEAIDISDLKRLEEKNHRNEELLVKASGYDTITNLPERKFFDDRLEKIIARTLRFADGQLAKIKTIVAVFIIDIDGFSKVEETLGKTISEKLLGAIAIRLLSNVDEADTVAKNAGDQFLLIIEGFPNSNRIITTENDIKNIAEYLLKTMRKPFNIMGEEIEIQCSIGISYFPKHGRAAQLLLRVAQSAVDVIKSSGGNQFLIAG